VLAGVRGAVARSGFAEPISLRLDVWMAPKYHPTPLSGGDRKALAKELGKARAIANILAAQSAEMRAKDEAMIQQADRLLCESWNERMWSDGEGRELATARWGMPSSQHALMEATKKRAAKLEAKDKPVDSRNCCGWSRTAARLTSAT
jgi:hypothetical protein